MNWVCLFLVPEIQHYTVVEMIIKELDEDGGEDDYDGGNFGNGADTGNSTDDGYDDFYGDFGNGTNSNGDHEDNEDLEFWNCGTNFK